VTGEKILIVEDEQDIARLMAILMQERGYRTVIAYDGVKGLNLALQERPDLILLDLRLPEMGGMQLLYKLHEHQVDVPVVLVTAWGSEDLVIEALRLGVKDYIKKPFTLEELLGMAERALAEGRLRRERDVLTEQLLISNQKLERRVRQLTALYEVGQALASTLDLDELLNVILQEASRVLEVSLASILMLDEQSGELVFRSGTGEKAEMLVGLRLEPGQGIAGWVAEHGEPLLVRQARSDPRFSPVFDEITGLVTASILCVPLMIKGRVIGVVEALNKPQAGFTEDDLAMLRLLAASAAVSIEHAQLFEEAHRRLRESEVLFRLGKQLAALLSLDRLLPIILDGAVELIPKADRSIIYLQEESSDTLQARANSEAGMSNWDALWEPVIRRRIVRRAMEEDRAIVAQVYQGPEEEAETSDLEAPCASILAVPLHVQEENLGVLTVDSRASQAFTSEDQRVLTIFANQAAIAIENTRLYQSLRESRAALT